MMRITAGLGNARDCADYRRAGADEVFIGFIPGFWQEKYGLACPLNRREVISCGAQIGGENELEIIMESGLPAAITLNSTTYDPELYPALDKVIVYCLERGFDSFIVADPAYIYHLYRIGLNRKIKLQVSGEAGETNRFFASELIRMGAKRIIFPRQTTIEEMRALTHGGIEYEAFCMNEKCHFQGAYCKSLHCDEMPPICREEYRLNVSELSASSEGDGCALCALYALDRAGVTHLKIVGRGARSETMLRSISQVKAALNEAAVSGSEEEYLTRLKSAGLIDNCPKNCYYGTYSR